MTAFYTEGIRGGRGLLVKLGSVNQLVGFIICGKAPFYLCVLSVKISFLPDASSRDFSAATKSQLTSRKHELFDQVKLYTQI